MKAFAPLLALLTLAPRPADALPASYSSTDAAAIAFVNLVREYPSQMKEYCAWLIKDADGKIRFGTINEGDMNRCPSSWPKPAGTVGSVHTHPIWGPGAKDVGAAGQVFSEGDYAHAEHADVGVTTYLGAPAGHILRYDPGNSLCWGKSFIMRRFKIVRDLNPGVRDRLPVKPDQKTPLYDAGGAPIPKPSYCVTQ